jgi:hypothetical protein
MAKPAAAVLLVALLAAGPASAEGAKSNDPEQMIREGAARILEGVRQFIDRIPQYAIPEMLPNGDIIIRRLPPRDPAWPQLGPTPDADGSFRT